jgi:hypothetical protein
MILVSLQLCKCAAVLLSLFHVRSVLLSYISCVVLVAVQGGCSKGVQSGLL